jgi:hypothetical protein
MQSQIGKVICKNLFLGTIQQSKDMNCAFNDSENRSIAFAGTEPDQNCRSSISNLSFSTANEQRLGMSASESICS